MRDENGFKMHTQSESHVRQMLLIGEDPKKYINDYSNQFQKDFLQLLRTSHGEKKVQINHFYQEYIGNKEHVHMNSTKWPSLTEFAKFLGREGICRVEENEKGIHVSWIDNSPEALRRQDAIRKKDRQDRGDEEREQTLIRQQVRKAAEDAESRADGVGTDVEGEGELIRAEGEKIKLSFSAKPAALHKKEVSLLSISVRDETKELAGDMAVAADADATVTQAMANQDAAAAPKVSMKIAFSNKPRNVFTAAKKNALGTKKVAVVEIPKKMSEAERIMKEEIERKRSREAHPSGGPAKRPRI